MSKIRLDKLIQNEFDTRMKAQDAIKEGRVFINGKAMKKPGVLVEETVKVKILPADQEFVSRAGGKLQGAVDQFHIDLKNQVVLDIGASTGGFTDVCLQQNAKKVYALDVGHLQLSKKLKEDPRVVEMEGVNARYIEPDWFDEKIDFVCMDVSFISCLTILKPLFEKIKPEHLVVLIKPQFECGPQALNSKGVLKNDKLRTQIIETIKQFVFQSYQEVAVMDSTVIGRSGNREALLYAKNKR